ncbi:hypothetical protein LTR37_013114 [Vermiconidia calcicola]|uniref:Uncharacterized protein n=1 Tax=Vermiconidia calcicola TaxID=1690605 RepID=A0ACC3MXZ2_9PEZI|nr:hypothetical protein LTR37_013114 [Vermiconidia calcicola]
MDFTGSPKKKLSASFTIFEDHAIGERNDRPLNRSSSVMPLTTSKLANQLPPRNSPIRMGNRKEDSPVSELLARLTHQQEMLSRQKQQLDDKSNSGGSSSPTDPYANTPPTESVANSDGRPDAAEVLRLQKELELTRERMAQMDLELTQSRLARHTVEEAIGSPFPAAQHLAFNIMGQSMQAQNGLQGRASPFRPAGPATHGPGGGLWIDTGVPGGGDMYTPQNTDPSPVFPRPSSGFGGRPMYQPGYTPPMTPLGFPAPYAMPNGANHHQQLPIGTRLSPTATEFPHHAQGPWNAPPGQGPAYMNTTEPLNYRRLLDRNMSCNWKYIVDKIVCNNDQQASIFLQQKLKVATADQKFEIVNGIIDQAYPLMVNRFGNFLVQRCFEHGTPEQVVAIAQAIRGNTLNLSMDAFGCHVVQKAFDCVPEEYKAIMVHELLRRIPETVIHRYACHVWQKLFELRWSGSPPQIMKYVNEALRGMWHEVALGETGSLVVQNIFENCLEEDKRPCVNEVLASIDVVAHGQFGNWCIQHLCEHGSIPDRTRAIDHVIRYATEYSMDQFASKVVEKCLKIGSTEFLDRYLDRVCEARPERPRMPLIDIAGDQFGNYLIQYILSNADPQRREIVAAHIRKHMVSLRGSKYGSRVAMLCSNPAFATRPGPPTGMSLSRNNSSYGDRFGSDMTRTYSNERQYGGMSRGGYGAPYR